MFVDKITIDFPIFLLFFNTKFPIFPIFSILSFLFSYFFEQPCRWTPCALSHSLHFVRHEGRLATHTSSQSSKSGSRLPNFNSVCPGLVSGQIDSPYLFIMSLITIPRDEYHTAHGSCRLPRHGRYSLIGTAQLLLTSRLSKREHC